MRSGFVGIAATHRSSAGRRLAALAPLAAASDFAYVEPDEPAAHGWMVAVRADGPGSATRARPAVVFESGRSVLRVANPSFPGIAVSRAGETMMRVVAVFVGREVRGAVPSLPLGRPEAAEGAFRGMSPGGGIR